MDLDEEGQARESDLCEDKFEEKATEKFGNGRKSRKNDSALRGKDFQANSSLENRSEKSRSRSRSRTRKSLITASSKKSWKSANAWLNFMQDFRKNVRGLRGMRNADLFRLAGERWSEMSAEEKKPYIEAANKVKRKKQLEKDNDGENERKKRAKPKKSEAVMKSSNKKKENNAEENDDKSDSEYDSGEEASEKNAESDNASLDSDESV